MNAASYINTSLEVFCSILSVFIIIHLIMDDTKNTKLNRLFIITMICNIVNLLSDAACWFVMGNTARYAVVINYVGTFLVYVLNYITPAFFASYIAAYIETKTKVSPKKIYSIYSLATLGVAAIIFSQFTDLFYYIDADNIYHRTEACNYIFFSQILCVFVIGAMVAQYGKKIGKRDTILISTYIILPLLGTAVQVSSYGIAGTNIASTLSVFIIYFGIQSEQSKQLKQKELELSESRIAIMLSQIQPHFLYNSLTAIGKLCDIDAKKAKLAVTDFADYLRGNLDSLGGRKLVYFEDELDHVEAYLALEQLRYKERLRVVYDIAVGNFIIPPLTVQPLVENAVQHGLMERNEGGTVCIRTELTERDARITVTDDGVGFDPTVQKNDGRTHVGIENVRGRIFAMCGGSLEITSAPGKGTTAVIVIPRNTEE